MSNFRFLTLHIIDSLPLHNLNRNDRGMPKTVYQGGVNRGMLSSQSLKRAARILYEEDTHDLTYRSKQWLDMEIAKRAKEERQDVDADEVKARAGTLIKALTASVEKAKKKAAKAAEEGTEVAASKDTSTWLSSDEIEQIAASILQDIDENRATDGKAPIGENRKTGSLSIAAFGRMFASAAEKQTVSAIAVSPAVTTHQIALVDDYFTTVDDLADIYAADNQGAAYLDRQAYTTGIYYHTVTIDRDQLGREGSWIFSDLDDAKTRLAAMVRALVYGIPSGKKSSTSVGGSAIPVLVMAEEQRYRTAYDFESPVQPDRDGGYLKPTLQRLFDERKAGLAFDAGNFGKTNVAGIDVPDTSDIEANSTNLQGIVDHVVEWWTEGNQGTNNGAMN